MSELTDDDPFSAANLGPAILIQLSRCYDLLAVIATGANPRAAKTVLDIHEAGGLVGGPPYFVPEPDGPEAAPSKDRGLVVECPFCDAPFENGVVEHSLGCPHPSAL